MLVAGLIGSFVLIIAGFAIAKAKYKGDFKVEPSWIAAALAPTIIWLLASGQLTEFSGLGVSFELSEATKQSFSLDLAGSKVDVQEISQEVIAAGVELIGGKGGASLIEEYIEKGISAISIEMGRTRYYSSYGVAFAIEELTKHESFKYVVLVNEGGQFRGLIPARKLLSQLGTIEAHGPEKWEHFLRVIEKDELDEIQSVITQSILPDGTKHDAFKIMAKHELTELPVVKDNRLIGVIQLRKLLDGVLVELFAKVN